MNRDRIVMRISVTGPTYQIPTSPKYKGSTKVRGIEKKYVLVRLIRADLFASPIAWKKPDRIKLGPKAK